MVELTKQITVGEMPIVIRQEGSETDGKWKMYVYEDYRKIGPPSKKWIENAPLIKTDILDDINLNRRFVSIQCVCHLVTYVYVNEDYSFIGRMSVDDEGCLYVNDEYALEKMPGNQWISATLPFKKGWNKLEVIMWNGGATGGFEFENKLVLDEMIKKLQYEKQEIEYKPYVFNAMEDEITSINIKPSISKFNLAGDDLLNSNMMYEHVDINEYDRPQPKYGGTRYRLEHTHAFENGQNWVWYWTHVSQSNSRPFLFKPNTKYTVTYYLHEYVNELENPVNGHPTPYLWIGDSYYSYGKTPGLKTMTITTDRVAHTHPYSPLRICYYATTPMLEGSRRILDVELISIVEGETPELKNTSFFSMTGDKNGLSMTTQDYDNIVGQYKLQGEIPDYLNNIQDKIERKNNEFNVSWLF